MLLVYDGIEKKEAMGMNRYSPIKIGLLAWCLSQAPFAAAAGTIDFFQSSAAQNDLAKRIVPVDTAFEFLGFVQGERLQLLWRVEPGHYLYRSRLKVAGPNGDLVAVQLPEAEPYHDEYFGEVLIYREDLALDIPIGPGLTKANTASKPFLIEYQGCAEAGYCYPPQKRWVELD
jgi:thioredoxin:protein disulfide reductase